MEVLNILKSHYKTALEWISLKANLKDCEASMGVLYIGSSLYSLLMKERKEETYLIPLGKDPTFHFFENLS